ncbi:zinc finger protein 569-like isoform X3 [Perca fluviatilis]|uniref:zinc finger protein 569-like isoform X3 n=1 Tax=Perca fluviatilis TaxID=8168 RepID=UPI0019666EDA|nr:zinc finger protein 569-like isoform X3 [Perca fluviatilis]
MSKVQMLRAFVNQRLTAAAEEIFGLFERTIAEYEEELGRSKEENERQQKRLDAVCDPEVRLHRAGWYPYCVCWYRFIVIPLNSWGTSGGGRIHNLYRSKYVQQLLVVKAEVPPEQHEWSSSLDQEEPEPPPHIKEELWTSQEGEQLQGLEEADIKFPFTSVPVKSEEDGEKAQSSQLHESQTEENREAERTEAEGEDRGGPEPARNSDPDSPLQPATHDKTADSSEPETDDSIDWVETREPQSGLNPLQNNVEPGSDVKLNTGNPSFSSSECAGSFGHEEHLQKPTGVQKRGKKYCCSVCGKGYTRKKSLCSHMRLHSEGKGFTCSVCKAIFSLRSNLTIHMRIHTGEKPFSCSVCDKRYAQKGNLKKHLIAHTHTTFSCSVCGKGFSLNKTLMTHMRLHSENVSPAQFVK